jgi:hypothetical protein
MDEARTRGQWSLLSHVLAWIQNTVAGEGDLVTPQQLNPYAEDDAPAASSGITITPSVLRALVKAQRMRNANSR